MQNKYVGDVGDFGKYGLLRSLSINSNLKLGVNWCLVDRDEGNNDGKHTAYLNLCPKHPCPDLQADFQPCDEELYKILQQIVAGNKRSVAEIENSHILGEKTIFYSDILGQTKREVWHKNGLKALEKANVVFFDPDNGLEVITYPKTRKNHVKYVYYDELADYYNRGQSLIVYNHKDRKPPEEYLEKFFTVYQNFSKTKPIGEMFLLRFHRFSVRDYFFVLQPDHVEEIKQIVLSFISGNWGRMFDLVDLLEYYNN